MGCFIETFGQSTGIGTVSVRSLTANPLAKLAVARRLRVVDFAASGGLTRGGRRCQALHRPSRSRSPLVPRYLGTSLAGRRDCVRLPTRSAARCTSRVRPRRRCAEHGVVWVADIARAPGAPREYSGYVQIRLGWVTALSCRQGSPLAVLAPRRPPQSSAADLTEDMLTGSTIWRSQQGANSRSSLRLSQPEIRTS